MKATENCLKQIKTYFQNAVNLQQSCKILIATSQGDSWSFYFKKGSLVWASSSNHRFRRLYRLTNQICPEVNCQEVKLREQEISELWEYLLISVLYKRKQITITQVREIIQAIIKEVLFDCWVFENEINQIKVIFETKGNRMGAILKSSLFKQPITNINYKKTIERLESSISEWKKNNLLTICYPNFAPVIKDINKLKKAVDPDTYQQLFIFINGKKTLRDLAVITKQDLLEVAIALAPHLKSKAIALQQVPDQQLSDLYFSPSSPENRAKYKSGVREYIQELDLPLIICVDDDPHICQKFAEILNPVGYRLLSVNDAAKTLMILLDNQPCLIFLDTEMPDANGYELCAQIKKMPGLKTIPVIILSEKETTIDRVRSKMVGAADIINKQIEPTELLTLTQKYTQNFVDRKALISRS